MFEKIGPSGMYAIVRGDDDAGGLLVLAAAETGGAGVHAGTEAAGGHGGAHKEPFPPFNSATFPGQLLWLAIFFGLLFWLMSKVALPRVGAILESRAERIANDLREANRLKQESEASIAAYETTLADARAEGHRIAAETHEKVAKEVAEHRAELEAALETQLAESENQIASTKASALANVRGIAVDTAAAIVERLSGKPAAGAEIERAVDAALAK